MAQQQITLVDYSVDIPDPRHAQGKRHEWLTILVVICVALVCGQKTVWAMAHWAVLHAREIITALQPTTRRLPSVSTFYRALRKVNIAGLETCIAAYG